MIRNIVFDFGNVIGRYNSEELIGRFCQAQADRQAFRQAIFYDWASLDAGRISYEVYTAQALERLPSRLHTAARAFFHDWYRYLPYMDGVPELIADLKEQNVPRYLLSNASVFFAQHLDFYDAVQGFDGIVISGEVQMAKPEPGIYTYLLTKYALRPEECFFIDDLEENIRAARQCGMEGYVFDGDTPRLRKAIFSRLGRQPSLAKRRKMGYD